MRVYRKTENRRYFPEKVKNWPHNFVVLGDALCFFSIVYGQGMTSAALQAMALNK